MLDDIGDALVNIWFGFSTTEAKSKTWTGTIIRSTDDVKNAMEQLSYVTEKEMKQIVDIRQIEENKALQNLRDALKNEAETRRSGNKILHEIQLEALHKAIKESEKIISASNTWRVEAYDDLDHAIRKEITEAHKGKKKGAHSDIHKKRQSEGLKKYWTKKKLIV